MPIVFPTGIDTASTFPVKATLAAEKLSDEPHSELHGDIGAAILALEAKVGITSSADTNSLDYKINHPSGTGVPTGSLVPFAGAAAPAGFLLCFGQQVSTATYAALYAVVGTTYGSGGGTFGIPDLRGRVLMGLDNMGGSAASRVSSATSRGASGGESTHALITAELASHNHSVTVSISAISGTISGTTAAGGAHSHNYTYDVISFVQGGGLGPFAKIFDSGYNNGGLVASTAAVPATHTHTFTGTFDGGATGTGSSGTAGSGTPHNNLQPYIALNWLIAV